MGKTDDIKKVLSAIEGAIRSEIEGYNFYLWASTKTKDPKGKSVFRELAGEEIKHLKILEGEYVRHGGVRAWREPGAEDVTKEKTFEIGKGIRMKIGENTTEKDALKMALTVEQEAMDFYRNLAKETENHDLSKVFHGLSEMEDKHLEMIKYRYELYTR
ncbi:MAG: ferritin family protein [Nitrospirae bacterium]|nr:ferritin family protein [Nitrospirota bacterium]